MSEVGVGVRTGVGVGVGVTAGVIAGLGVGVGVGVRTGVAVGVGVTAGLGVGVGVRLAHPTSENASTSTRPRESRTILLLMTPPPLHDSASPQIMNWGFQVVNASACPAQCLITQDRFFCCYSSSFFLRR